MIRYGPTIALKHPLRGPRGPITEVKLRAGGPIRRRPRDVSQDIWDLAAMTGLEPKLVREMSEADGLAIVRIWRGFADTVVAGLGR